MSNLEVIPDTFCGNTVGHTGVTEKETVCYMKAIENVKQTLQSFKTPLPLVEDEFVAVLDYIVENSNTGFG